MQNMLLVLRQGGRLAARRGLRTDDERIVLIDSAYTACAVETAEGCAQDPSWRITADGVSYDPDTQMIRFAARGWSCSACRWCRCLDADPRRRAAGLGPRHSGPAVFRVERGGGQAGYYWRIARNRDLTIEGTSTPRRCRCFGAISRADRTMAPIR